MPTGQWLKGWNKERRIKIVLDKDKISAALTHFPHRIHLSKASGTGKYDARKVFDELGVNSLKIAVTKADGITQLYVEIDNWNAANKTADLWVSRSNWTISSTVDTVIYLYYDKSHADNSAYVGVTGSAPAELVWDANFKLVSHMNDNPDTGHVMDSTSNDNDGTKKGANEPIETTGKIGKAQDNDLTDDYIKVTDSASLNTGTYRAFELWVKMQTKDATIDEPCRYGWFYLSRRGDLDGRFEAFIKQSDGISKGKAFLDSQLPIDEYHHVFIVADGTNVRHYLDSVEIGLPVAYDGTYIDTAVDLFIGAYSAGARFVDAIIDEFRVYAGNSFVTSAAWVGASYQTQTDNLNFLSLEIREATIQGAPVPKPPLKRTFILNVRDWLASKNE